MTMGRMERLEYEKKPDRAILHSSQYFTIILDYTDQSRFGLPHFCTSLKTQRGHTLKLKLIVVFEIYVNSKLHLYTMTNDRVTGANHIYKTVCRLLITRRLRA